MFIDHLKVFYQFFSPDDGGGAGGGGDDGGSGGESTTLYVKDDTGAFSEYEAPSFADRIPEDKRELFDGIESEEQLLEKYAEMQGKVPAVPESPDAYEINYPEELGYTDEDMSAIKQGLHKLGLTPDQAKGLVQLDNELTSKRIEEAKTEAARVVGAEEAELKHKLGDNYDQFTEHANAGLALLEEKVPGFLELVSNAYSGGAALTARASFKQAMSLLGKAASEKPFLESGGAGPVERPVGPDGRPRLAYPSMEKGSG
jgi:hypothetical protein